MQSICSGGSVGQNPNRPRLLAHLVRAQLQADLGERDVARFLERLGHRHLRRAAVAQRVAEVRERVRGLRQVEELRVLPFGLRAEPVLQGRRRRDQLARRTRQVQLVLGAGDQRLVGIGVERGPRIARSPGRCRSRSACWGRSWGWRPSPGCRRSADRSPPRRRADRRAPGLAAACRSASIVVSIVPPFLGRPRIRSVNVEIASSGASPDR